MNLASKLAEERRARLAAERLLELKQAELHAANRKLGQHALAYTLTSYTAITVHRRPLWFGLSTCLM